MALTRDPSRGSGREGAIRGAFSRIFGRASAGYRYSIQSAPVELQTLLERTYRALRPESPSLPGVMTDLADGLYRTRAACDSDQWRSTAELIRRHPVTSAIHLDPLTHRGFHKPRGHPADAVMIDLAYRDRIPPEESPRPGTLGARLWDCTSAMPFARAVRNRRDIIARQIDAIAERSRAAELLAIEAGHLREAELSHSIRRGAFRRVVAVDQDGHAIATIAREFGRYGVSAIHTPSYALLGGAPNALGHFDLIYSASLLDGLEAKPARRALAAMFSMLKPGGKLLVANLRPSIRDAAYIEAFMNWWPAYRDDEALNDLAGDIPSAAIQSRNMVADPTGNIGFLELVRAR